MGERERHFLDVGFPFKFSPHFFQSAGEVAKLAFRPCFQADSRFAIGHALRLPRQAGDDPSKIRGERVGDEGGKHQCQQGGNG